MAQDSLPKIYNNQRTELWEHNSGDHFTTTDGDMAIGVNGKRLIFYSKGSQQASIILNPDGTIQLLSSMIGAIDAPYSYMTLGPSGAKFNGAQAIYATSASPCIIHQPMLDPPVINPGVPGTRPSNLSDDAIASLQKAVDNSNYKLDLDLFSERPRATSEQKASSLHRYGDNQYMNIDYIIIPEFVSIPAVTYILGKVITRIADPEVLREVQEISKFTCFLTVDEIAALLSGYTLDPQFIAKLIQSLIIALQTPSLLQTFVQYVINKINCFLSIAYFLQDYVVSADDQALLDKTIQVTYFGLSLSEKAQLQTIEQTFIATFTQHLETLEKCFGKFPEFPALITGTCINSIDQVLRLFGQSIGNGEWIQSLKNDVLLTALTAGDDLFIGTVLQEIRTKWSELQISQTIKTTLNSLFLTHKGAFIQLINTVAQSLMIGMEPLRRIVDFIKPGINSGVLFLKAIGTMMCLANKFRIAPNLGGNNTSPTSVNPILDTTRTYFKESIKDVEQQSIIKQAQRDEEVITARADNENHQEFLTEQQTLAEDEHFEATNDHERLQVMRRGMTDREYYARHPELNIGPPDFTVGGKWDNNLFYLNSQKDDGTLQHSIDDFISPNKEIYFKKIISTFPDVSMAVLIGKEAFGVKTTQALYDELKRILQEEIYDDAVIGRTEWVEPIDIAIDRLQVQSDLALERLGEINTELQATKDAVAAIEQLELIYDGQISQLNRQAEKNRKEFLEIDKAFNTCNATFIMSQLASSFGTISGNTNVSQNIQPKINDTFSSLQNELTVLKAFLDGSQAPLSALQVAASANILTAPLSPAIAALLSQFIASSSSLQGAINLTTPKITDLQTTAATKQTNLSTSTNLPVDDTFKPILDIADNTSNLGNKQTRQVVEI